MFFVIFFVNLLYHFFSIPRYWAGGSRIDLPNEGYGGEASAIYVTGGTVYTAGYYGNGGKSIPCYWAGTTEADTAKTDLPGGSGSHYEQARSVFVKDGMVYTAGGYSNGVKQIPCYWRGTERIDLQDGVVMSIFVS